MKSDWTLNCGINIFFYSFQELIKLYGGKGERSVESSAEIVGLRLPNSPTDPEKWRVVVLYHWGIIPKAL